MKRITTSAGSKWGAIATRRRLKPSPRWAPRVNFVMPKRGRLSCLIETAFASDIKAFFDASAARLPQRGRAALFTGGRFPARLDGRIPEGL